MNRRWRSAHLLCALALAACADRDEPAAPDRPAVTGIRFLAGGEVEGFVRAVASREFVFPADHGSHPEYRTEWWYFTGNLLAESGRHFGFELTFFRVALTPAPAERESAWGTNDVWLAHFALTDTAAGRFFADERISRGALGLAGATHSPFRVSVADWSAAGTLEGPAAAAQLWAATGDVGIDLELRGFDRLVAQGQRGLDRKGPEPGNASYYYSAPRLAVRGTVRAGAAPPHRVTGLAWMDREWGTSALSAGVTGWDWFALQLDDGRDLMYYRLRRADGTASEFSGGSLTDAAGATRRLEFDDVALEAVETWTSPTTGVQYPVGWNVTIPGDSLELQVRPRLRDQEVRLAVRYWEGAVEVRGRDGTRPISGSGYLELAGY